MDGGTVELADKGALTAGTDVSVREVMHYSSGRGSRPAG